jgi:hypothetical protein
MYCVYETRPTKGDAVHCVYNGINRRLAMSKNNFKIAFRNFKRYKGFASLCVF